MREEKEIFGVTNCPIHRDKKLLHFSDPTLLKTWGIEDVGYCSVWNCDHVSFAQTTPHYTMQSAEDGIDIDRRTIVAEIKNEAVRSRAHSQKTHSVLYDLFKISRVLQEGL